MELLSKNDIKLILKRCNKSDVHVLKWAIKVYSKDLVGYLGEHLSLVIYTLSGDIKSEIKFFIKCMPRFDEWKANYLRETSFFNKEYIMLSRLFKKFNNNKGTRMWRPQLFYIKEELFVFEDVTQMNYTMPSNLSTLSYDEIMATVAAVARFHAQSYIYEEQQTKLLNRPYRIWEDHADVLSEPLKGMSWRDTGMKAAIEFLKGFSKFRSNYKFAETIEKGIPELFNRAINLMKPSEKYRNVVVHRDVWSNNIFLKKLDNGKLHALIVDYQTVLYSAPTLDLSSMIYFNTTKHFRQKNINSIMDYYYEVLSNEMESENIDIESVLNRTHYNELYKESLVFGMTQAALIVPIIAMPDETRKEIFGNPDRCAKTNVVSRSQEFIELANENIIYKNRVIELLDDFVETFLYPSKNSDDCINKQDTIISYHL